LTIVLNVVSRIVSIGRAPDTNSWLKKLPRSTLYDKILNKEVLAFHSGVFSCLLTWVVTIVKRGCGGDTLECKTRQTFVMVAQNAFSVSSKGTCLFLMDQFQTKLYSVTCYMTMLSWCYELYNDKNNA